MKAARSIDFDKSIIEERHQHLSERHARHGSGEFIVAYYCLNCSCGASLAPGEPDLLLAFEPKRIEASAVDLLLSRERAPDEGWNHRILSFWDQYSRFMEVLPRFLAKHVSHGIEASLRAAKDEEASSGVDVAIATTTRDTSAPRPSTQSASRRTSTKERSYAKNHSTVPLMPWTSRSLRSSTER